MLGRGLSGPAEGTAQHERPEQDRSGQHDQPESAAGRRDAAIDSPGEKKYDDRCNQEAGRDVGERKKHDGLGDRHGHSDSLPSRVVRPDPEYPNDVDVVKANRFREWGEAMIETASAARNEPRAEDWLEPRAEDWLEQRGDYAIRFARTAEDRRLVQALRYEVFSRELGARVDGADRGLDIDPLDERADHLMVIDRSTGACVGSYRLVVQEQVVPGPGFYTQRIFDLGALDPGVLRDGVELGRACVDLRHRTRGVFQLLLRGIGAHLVRTGKRYLFGCGSVPLKEPGQSPRAIEDVEREGWIDHGLAVGPTEAYAIPTATCSTGARPELPALLYAYCAIGARLGPAPAWDADFGTLDFFVLLDLERVEPRTYARYCLPR